MASPKYIFRPLVPCELGPETIMISEDNIHNERRLHIIFHEWLGDDIITCYPYFMCSQNAKEIITSHRVTGVSFKEIWKIEVAEQYKEILKNMPKFFEIVISHDPSNDFYIQDDGELILSKKAFKIASMTNIKNSDIFENGKRGSLKEYLIKIKKDPATVSDKNIQFLCETFNLKNDL